MIAVKLSSRRYCAFLFVFITLRFDYGRPDLLAKQALFYVLVIRFIFRCHSNGVIFLGHPDAFFSTSLGLSLQKKSCSTFFVNSYI